MTPIPSWRTPDADHGRSAHGRRLSLPSHRAPARALWRALMFACLLGACASAGETDADAVAAADSMAAAAAFAAEGPAWRSLFDGETLAGWQGHRTPGAVPDGWVAANGTITRVAGGGDLVTAEQFASFELEFEWMVTPGGNSGVFYRVNPEVEVTYMSAPEYQVLDDARHADGQSPLTSAGAVYGLYPAPPGITRPAGEWNAGRIVVNGARVEHWLNGTRTAEYELWSPDWEQKVKDSKFAEWPAYGRAARGHVGLQDHGDSVAFRNLRIRELP